MKSKVFYSEVRGINNTSESELLYHKVVYGEKDAILTKEFYESIEGFTELLEITGLVKGKVITDDWTEQTLPSWLESIWQGIKRPSGLWHFGIIGFIKSLREVPTLLLMRIAFGTGLCKFGMFYAVKK